MSHKFAPHQKDGRFFNQENEERGSIFLRSLYMYCAGWRMRNSGIQELADWHQAKDELKATHDELDVSPVRRSLAVSAEALCGGWGEVGNHAATVTWIGHASFLIQLADYTILTDPVFNDLTLFFKRIQKPGIAREQLPRIDAVLISHNHRDHMERETLQYIAQKFPECIFLVPQGDNVWLQKWGIDRGVELSWWNNYTLSRPGVADSVNLIFLPAYHWSQRSVFDMNKSLWGSWMIEHAGKRIYFAGDTAYGKHFQSVAKEFNGMDCVLMPIGPCEPNEWMKKSHINAEEAGKAFLELGAQKMIPMHWGTYKFGMDRPLVPIERLISWWEQQKDQNTERIVLPLKIGGSTILT